MKIIVFFDGVCGLCSWSVDFLVKRDHKKKFLYSPLQGEEIKKHNLDFNVEQPESLIVWDGHKMRFKSEAWIFLMLQLGGVYRWVARPLSVFPYSFMNIFYDLIATFRYKIFGKRELCRIPSPEEQELFLH